MTLFSALKTPLASKSIIVDNAFLKLPSFNSFLMLSWLLTIFCNLVFTASTSFHFQDNHWKKELLNSYQLSFKALAKSGASNNP
ncbi:MAG: hypothetical protein LBC61_00950 [Candidatus Peribacteria bacterium]|nr:hypothetical protein [Candidatus Peribacteria bacterium]